MIHLFWTMKKFITMDIIMVNKCFLFLAKIYTNYEISSDIVSFYFHHFMLK